MIVRCLKIQEIKKIYDGREVNKNLRGALTLGCDYVVISIESAIESKENSETSVRYWVVNDQECLIPYDAFNFKIIDSYFPKSWIMNFYATRIEISHPKWAEYGYAEDYFDDVKVARQYNKIVKEIFDESVEAAKKKGLELNLGIKKLWTDRPSD